MYALKYGTVPVVRATGGLNDTITPFNLKSGNGNGVRFTTYTARAFFSAVKKAVSLFGNSGAWTRLMENGMRMDFSWQRSAQAYVSLYESVAESGKKETREDK